MEDLFYLNTGTEERWFPKHEEDKDKYLVITCA